MSDSLVINIVTSVDEKFFPNLKVLINSAKYHTKERIFLYLCVRDNSSKEFFKKKLSDFCGNNFDYEIIVVQNTEFTSIFKGRSCTHPIECYFRIILGSLLPASLKKVIYLDADMIINSDLNEIYSYPLRTSIGGVSDSIGHFYCTKNLNHELQIIIKNYINAGFMLINLDKWREKNIEKDMINFLTNNFHKLTLLDQDLINIFFDGDLTILDPKWNNLMFHGQLDKGVQGITGIYHLVGRLKGNSLFYPNYCIKKLYQFYYGSEQYWYKDLGEIFIYIFFSLPLGKFLSVKSKIHYRLNFHALEIWNFLWLLYPPVFLFFLGEMYDQFRLRGFKGFIKRIGEFL